MLGAPSRPTSPIGKPNVTPGGGAKQRFPGDAAAAVARANGRPDGGGAERQRKKKLLVEGPTACGDVSGADVRTGDGGGASPDRQLSPDAALKRKSHKKRVTGAEGGQVAVPLTPYRVRMVSIAGLQGPVPPVFVAAEAASRGPVPVIQRLGAAVVVVPVRASGQLPSWLEMVKAQPAPPAAVPVAVAQAHRQASDAAAVAAAPDVVVDARGGSLSADEALGAFATLEAVAAVAPRSAVVRRPAAFVASRSQAPLHWFHASLPVLSTHMPDLVPAGMLQVSHSQAVLLLWVGGWAVLLDVLSYSHRQCCCCGWVTVGRAALIS